MGIVFSKTFDSLVYLIESYNYMDQIYIFIRNLLLSGVVVSDLSLSRFVEEFM